ncbi:hypothetical protein M407DRAFT_109188 [Tulasnella calospora MUT 4182]|uniref:Uncharacterized protein n=1 Tax=Tulasnella calospora MUT 4182 TaxID=1051891 RepID=A0A0C3LPZ3_9AGAM|nr:hypothetical protein M407DRAFT_109188 [Tulasnella calospora MUT 4182]
MLTFKSNGAPQRHLRRTFVAFQPLQPLARPPQPPPDRSPPKRTLHQAPPSRTLWDVLI